MARKASPQGWDGNGEGRWVTCGIVLRLMGIKLLAVGKGSSSYSIERGKGRMSSVVLDWNGSGDWYILMDFNLQRGIYKETQTSVCV